MSYSGAFVKLLGEIVEDFLVCVNGFLEEEWSEEK